MSVVLSVNRLAVDRKPLYGLLQGSGKPVSFQPAAEVWSWRPSELFVINKRQFYMWAKGIWRYTEYILYETWTKLSKLGFIRMFTIINMISSTFVLVYAPHSCSLCLLTPSQPLTIFIIPVAATHKVVWPELPLTAVFLISSRLII